MADKRVASAAEAVSVITEGSIVLIGGFGSAGSPVDLVHALIDQGTKNLVVVNNNTGNGQVGLAALIANGQVRKMICSYPRSTFSKVFPDLYRTGKIELDLVPQGTLAERLRAGAAGIPAFYTPTAVGTPLADGKETREFEGREYVMERALQGDFALVRCDTADPMGNLTFNKTARNFGPVMCQAAKTTIVQARQVVDLGGIDPEHVVTAGIFVDRVVEITQPLHEATLVAEERCYP